MPAPTDAQMAEMQNLLASGPVLIGENHDLAHARGAIKRLIDLGAVKFLSIEAPIGPLNMVRADGQIADVAMYFNARGSGEDNTISTRDLAEYAIGKGVSVYFHDVPLRKSGLNFAASDRGANMNAYPDFAKTFLPPGMDNLPLREGNAASQFIQRNEYSAKYLKDHLGAGVRVLRNLIILGGADHFDNAKCGGNARTMQGHLGISDARVFDLS